MGKLQITFLGTGTSQGVPVIACDCEVCTSSDIKDKRLRSSILVQSETTSVVIDAGPDFRYQMLRENVQQLDAVVLTHEHKDHVGGLDDIRAFNFKQKKDMDIYCTARVENSLREQFSYAFADLKYPGVPKYNIINIDHSQPFTIGDLNFIPIQVMHHKLPVLGFRIGDFTYITDANNIEQEELKKLKGSKVLVLNALRHESHISHFTVAEAVELMQIMKPETGYLIHMSHLVGKHAEEEKKLPEFVHFSYDQLQVEVDY